MPALGCRSRTEANLGRQGQEKTPRAPRGPRVTTFCDLGQYGQDAEINAFGVWSGENITFPCVPTLRCRSHTEAHRAGQGQEETPRDPRGPRVAPFCDLGHYGQRAEISTFGVGSLENIKGGWV